MAVAALPADLVCRPGVTQDADFIIEVAAATFAELGDYRTIITQWLAEPAVSSAIACRGHEKHGFALVACHRPLGFRRRVTAELVAIAVVEGSRARGIGGLLLAGAEAIARGWDASEMRLHTARRNLVAQRFFARAGYQARKAATTSYPSGEPALALSRRLR
jgi:GNAT superfamily N-acetyltransferase